MAIGFLEQIDELQGVLTALRAQADAIERVTALVVERLRDGRTLFTCGNGGSATDAAHLSEELLGRYRSGSTRPPLPAICLNGESAALTCIGNDFGFEQVFARQLLALARPGDLLVCFSTSGNSPNIVAALHAAHERGVTSVALLGGDGGAALPLADYSIVVPSNNGARVQEGHTLLLHTVCEALEAAYR